MNTSFQPSRVLVVCRGNVCRSPTAAALLARAEAFGAHCHIESAGIQAVVGSGADPVMTDVLAGVEGLNLGGFEARQLTRDMIENADLVLTMTTRQRSEVLSLSPEAMGRTFTLTEFAELRHQHDDGATGQEGSGVDISDPHRRGIAAMRIAAIEVAHAVELISGRPDPALRTALAGNKSLRVMSSSPPATATTSPYVVLLTEALADEAGIEYLPFSWRDAMFSRIDVFHSHWPEAILAGANRFKTWARRLMFLVMLVNFRRTAIVQTMHNLVPHEAPNRINRWLLSRFHRRASIRISINATTPVTPGPPIRTILHGHFRGWFSRYEPMVEPSERDLIFFGLIRRYKAVDTLLKVFTATAGDLRLTVAGRADPKELAEELQTLAAHDDRVNLDLRFVPEDELVHGISQSCLAVLPYRELHNSGAAITALSLNRPILVPANESTDALAHEVGEEWVMRFEGEFTPEILHDAIRRAPAVIGTGAPNLSLRDWTLAGALHLAAFREATIRAAHHSRPSNP